MWDVASAGPLSGAAVSALLLGAGLLQSGGDAASLPDMMVGLCVCVCVCVCVCASVSYGGE